MDWRNKLPMIVNKIKYQLHAKKLDDLESVSKYVFEFDFDGNKVLDKVEFGKFLAKSGIFLSTQELTCVYNHYDKNRDGAIDYNEFIQMIRTDMSDKRLGVVKYAFNFLDAEGTKVLRLDDLRKQFHAEDHPRVRTREKTPQQVYDEFNKAMTKKSSDGEHITEDEFLSYYADVNATMPSEKEEYFSDLVIKTWGITTSESYVSPERMNDLQIILYEKIRQKTDDHNDEGKTIKKAFKYFDLEDKGVINLQQFTKALEKFGCVFSKYEILALFRKYDKDNSGKLCYDEFSNLFASIGSGTNPNVNPVFELARQPPKDIINKARNDCIKKGIYGVRNYCQILRHLDKTNKGGITRNDFLWASKEAGTSLTKHDLDKVYQYFDKNVENFVRYPEFIELLRGGLNQTRGDVINAVWQALDPQASGVVPFELIQKCFTPMGQHDVIIGKTKPDHAYKDFLGQWTLNKDRTISYQDFVEFYNDVSASFNNDNQFVDLINKSWAIPEGLGQAGGEGNGEQPEMKKSKVTFAQ